MDKKTTIIALCGKGGVGKTSISALTVKLLAQAYPDKNILAIDADPAIGLATALGIEVSATVNDIRNSFIEMAEGGDSRAAIEMLGDAHFKMIDTMVEVDNISFLAIGRPESSGCYCKVNAYLKEIISRVSSSFDFVIIDGEAGIEQVNRRVMEKVTHLILVSDASKKGIEVIKTIQDVAKDLVMFEKSGAIINRMPDMSLKDVLNLGNLEMLSCIPDDRDMTMNDLQGKTVFDLADDSTISQGVKQALINFGVIN